MKIIEEQWQEYHDKVINPEAGLTQRMVMEEAFYSGALAMYAKIVTGCANSTPKQSKKLMDDLIEELMEFGNKHTNQLRQTETKPGIN